jgi:hypothetical protein
MAPKWEYKIVYIDALRWTRTGLPAEINQDFDEWGSQGWELVATEGVIRKGWGLGNDTVAIVAFFKRKVDG